MTTLMLLILPSHELSAFSVDHHRVPWRMPVPADERWRWRWWWRWQWWWFVVVVDFPISPPPAFSVDHHRLLEALLHLLAATQCQVRPQITRPHGLSFYPIFVSLFVRFFRSLECETLPSIWIFEVAVLCLLWVFFRYRERRRLRGRSRCGSKRQRGRMWFA